MNRWVWLCLLLGITVTQSQMAIADDASRCEQLYSQKNYVAAFPVCIKEAEKGHAEAQYKLSEMYLKGYGISKNISKSLAYLEQAANQGHEQAQAGWSYHTGNYSSALVKYKKLAGAGHSDAQVMLGIMHENGKGTPIDECQALLWYRKAADQNNMYAENNIGIFYKEGQCGLQKNQAVALVWFIKAANHGLISAQARVGSTLLHGYEGVSINYGEALYWLKKAAQSGHLESQYELGTIYEFGKSVAINHIKARYWYKQAAKGGHHMAAYKISQIQKLAQKKQEASKVKVPSRSPKMKKRSISFGTGWAVSGSYVVTNNHVVAGHKKFTLLRTDGVEISASVVMRDAANDLALLKIQDPSKMPRALRLASMPARIGDKVFTIGYPHPTMMGAKPKLTNGIVSAVTGVKDDPRTYQISVPLQAGNSGGPLLNMDGEVVGIVTAKLSAVKMFKWTGDLPQNVNYAVKSAYLSVLLSTSPKGKKGRRVSIKDNASLADLADSIKNSVMIVIAE